MIKLSHVGEILLAEMIKRSQAVRRLLGEHDASVTEAENELRVESEVRLCTCGSYGFDGAHKLDVVLLLGRTRTCLGIEAKLGTKRLGKGEFERRFLGACRTSHGNTRIAGSMIAILDGRLPDSCDRREVFVQYEQTRYRLLPMWFLVVRERTLKAWSQGRCPGLSCNCAIIAFDMIVKKYGGRDKFNSLVAELVGGDYYREWIEDA
jgi:hypothetical protein